MIVVGPVLQLIHCQGLQALRNREALLHGRVGQQQPRAAVLHHVQQAITRVFDIQRHVHATGLQHREERHHDLGTARHGNRHAHFRADATGDQRVGQAVGLAIQLAVSELLVGELHRHRIRGFPGTVGHQFMHQTLGRETGGATVPQLQDVLLLGGVQQVQLAKRLPRVGDHALQQVLPVARHALHGAGFEQVLGITQGGPDAFGGLLNVQVEVEMRGLALPFQPLDQQVRQVLLDLGLADVGLVVEHHLEQRIVAQAAFRLQGFHQLFERQVLMGLGLKRALPGLLQQLLDAHLAVQVRLEDLGIDEEADQPLGFAAVAVGDGHADADFFLAAVAVQQGLERRQQQHEQGHALLPGQGLEMLAQLGVQLESQACAAMALHGGTRVVERQLQHTLLAAEHFAPVRQLTVLLARLHPIALPHGIVGILDRQRRQLHFLALAVARIELHQFFDHHLHRPAIGDDVVLHQHQHMLISSHAQQRHTQQRAVFQVERLRDLRLDLRLEFSLVDIGVSDLQRRRWRDHLHCTLMLLAQAGAQAFMPGQQRIETALQRAQVQLPFQAQRTGDVVSGAVRLQLPEKPLTLLGIRQRQGVLAPDRQQRRCAGRQAVLGLQCRNKCVQPWVLEQGLERHLALQRLANARHHLHRQQRMPAQFKEVLVQTDVVGTENIGPDRSDLLLQRGDRRLPVLVRRAGVRFGQCLAVQLAVGVERHALEEDQVRRHHVVRQLFAQGVHQAFGFTRRLRGHQVGQQLVVDSQHQRFAHAVLGQQHGFDLAQFDAEAAHFHLMVDPPDILHHPVGAITRQVAAAIKPLAAGTERVGDKTLGGQARAPQISAGQAAGAGDVEFAYGTDRQQIQVAIQHIQPTPG
ncbi:hypothetical protein [Pseudomonas sp. 44 R 15]|nr:hypothetical protein [Pseudomonas sp. 44 R 15]